MRHKAIVVLFTVGLITASVYLGTVVVSSPDTGLTVLAGAIPALLCGLIILQQKTDQRFLLRLYLAALILRWGLAWLIYTRHQQLFFGGDAETFDIVGNALSSAWSGLGLSDSPYMLRYTGVGNSGWGMFYYVGSIYYVIGHNALAVQLINSVFGAATCVVVYKIALMIYPSQRVARTAAILTAFSPSMILWSSQMLKDAPIVLCLTLSALYTLKLRSRFALMDGLLLLLSLFCLFTLRHYAFYIMFIAIAATLLFAARNFTPLKLVKGGLLVVTIGVMLSYMGAGRMPGAQLDMKRVQASRLWSAKVANTGYGGDVDITDPQAAIAFLPIGVLYVLFAPFPWMITNLRQMITLPELLVWWALIPMFAKGFWHAARHRLKESFAICVFTLGLTLAYALYQSNVGTAYRHRAQLYVFFFIFIGIGIELRREARLRNRLQPAIVRPAFATLVTAPESVQLRSNPSGSY